MGGRGKLPPIVTRNLLCLRYLVKKGRCKVQLTPQPLCGCVTNSRVSRGVPPPQPAFVTEIDAGHETPDATRCPVFFMPFFQVKIKRCIWHFSPCERELNFKTTFLGAEFSHFREDPAPFFIICLSENYKNLLHIWISDVFHAALRSDPVHRRARQW